MIEKPIYRHKIQVNIVKYVDNWQFHNNLFFWVNIGKFDKIADVYRNQFRRGINFYKSWLLAINLAILTFLMPSILSLIIKSNKNKYLGYMSFIS